MDMRCYCCAAPISGKFALISMSKNADRVFVVQERCIPKVDEDAAFVLIVQVKRKAK